MIQHTYFLFIRFCFKVSWPIINFIQGKILGFYSRYHRNRLRSFSSNVFFKNIGQLEGGNFIEVGDGTCFGNQIFLTAWPHNANTLESAAPVHIKIGNNCIFGAYNHITAVNYIEIGDGFLSGKWVTITDNSHGSYSIDNVEEMEKWSNPPIKRPIVSKGTVIIGKNVWVGDKVTILPDVTIGDGAVIAANAVVTKNIPAYSIAAGNPAKIIKIK